MIDERELGTGLNGQSTLIIAIGFFKVYFVHRKFPECYN